VVGFLAFWGRNQVATATTPITTRMIVVVVADRWKSHTHTA
jgi:hypothetical protein